MELASFAQPLVGGGLIGVAVTLMLLFNGRVTGVSGILGGVLEKPATDGSWRWLFLLGLILGGVISGYLRPDLFLNSSDRSLSVVGLAGLLVGFGTAMGGGCTSGHGICGISRLSPRSAVATATFMTFGFIAVQVLHFIFGSTQ